MIIWSFRRLRLEAVAVAAALAGVATVALVTGRMMSNHFRSSGLADCLAAAAGRSDCRGLLDAFNDRFQGMRVLIIPLVLLPAVFGAFVGAPLVAREVEAGTHRFFWTQSITRRRWLGWAMTAALVLAAVSGAIFTLIAAGWLHVTNQVVDERFGQLYEMQGVLPVAATVMAVAIGVLAGTLIRRTLPAMAATIGAFIVVRVVVGVWLRPHLLPVEVVSVPLGPDDPLDGTGAWRLSEQLVDATGRVLTRGDVLDVTQLTGLCPSLPAGSGGRVGSFQVDQCLRELGATSVIRYHPGNQYWAFQVLESAVLLGVAGIAAALAVVAIRRRAI